MGLRFPSRKVCTDLESERKVRYLRQL